MRHTTGLNGTVLLMACLAGVARADWTSAGTGQHFGPAELVAQSAGTLMGTWPEYTLAGNLVLAAGDSLSLPADCRITANGLWELRIQGFVASLGTAAAPVELQAATAQPGAWDGLVLDGAAEGSTLRHTRVRHGDRGLSVLGCAPRVQRCELSNNFSTGLHCFLGGNPVVEGTLIEGNSRYGVEITGGSSPLLRRCVIRGNNTEGTSARNAVSTGIQGSNSPVLEACLLEGLGSTNPASGFSQWLLGNPRLAGCEIRQFRSGVVIQGSGALGRLEGCYIHGNRYSNPIQGGSGINVNSAAGPVFRDCRIRDNDWGVTLTSACTPDFGLQGEPGGNGLWDNGNGGQVHDFFNNTTSAVSAVGNWWGTLDPALVEEHINDDDDGAYGQVQFEPLEEATVMPPFAFPGLGWQYLSEPGATLALSPAGRFLEGATLELSVSGHGQWSWAGDSLYWQAGPADPSPALLVFAASDELGRTALDSLWIHHEGALVQTAPRLDIVRQGNNLLLGWTPLPGALAYRVYRRDPAGLLEDELLGETPGLDWLLPDALGQGRGAWRVRAVLPEAR